MRWVPLLLLAACHAPKPPPPPTGSPPPICTSHAANVYPGSCGMARTAQGYLCALCLGDYGCVDAATWTYCTGAAVACDDPACVRL